MRGTGPLNYFVITGLDMVNCKMTGNNEVGAKFYPTIAMPVPKPADAPAEAAAAAPVDVEAADAPVGDDPAPMEAELLRDSRAYKGWRTSYSKVLDHGEEKKRFVNYLNGQMKHLSSATEKLDAPKRRLTLSERRADHLTIFAKKKTKAKQTSDYYRALRA